MSDDDLGDRPRPESEMMRLGWDPARGHNSLKPPIFQTSTFTFPSAEAAERLFDVVYGGSEPTPGEEIGFIYTRMDHPNLAIVEERLARWDGAEAALLFSSGLSALFTTLFTFLRPGDPILHTSPIYGGTNTLLHQVLAPRGHPVASFGPDAALDDILALGADRPPGVIHVETPANPTNDVFDISLAVSAAGRFTDRRPLVVVDNTFLGPYAQKPLEQGADLVVYSATKYFGGHSDLVAGAVTGRSELLGPLKTMRYRIGTTADPHTAWLLGRSLETYALRVARQTENAARVAAFLAAHPKVAGVNYLGLIPDGDPRADLAGRQWTSAGAMISFELTGGKAAAFAFLDSMRLIAHTTSLGGSESLACHPWTTTHANVDPETKREMGIGEGMVRLSVGIEAWEDLVAELTRALGS